MKTKKNLTKYRVTHFRPFSRSIFENFLEQVKNKLFGVRCEYTAVTVKIFKIAGKMVHKRVNRSGRGGIFLFVPFTRGPGIV